MMSKKIVLLNTFHVSFDDRVFYHQAKSLSSHGFEVKIISTKGDCIQNVENISINSFNDSDLSNSEKINEITRRLIDFSPAIIICDSPSAIIAANKYKKNREVRIIYDITEWYPSKLHLQYTHGIRKPLKFIVLLMLNLFAGLNSDSFIFGEYYKSVVFRRLFFWKKFIQLPYYPDLNYIQNYPLKPVTSEMNLLYCGKINTDRGIDAVIMAIESAAVKYQEIQFRLKIIGIFPTIKDQNHFNDLVSGLPGNIQISIEKLLPFSEFCKSIGNTHLIFDLRKIDFESTHCLPIKLFYYLACGRPVLYSDLLAIRHHIKEFDFGYLCHPKDIPSIATHITDYIANPGLYLEHAGNALEISRSTYNWKAIENDFLTFIDS